MVTQLLGFRKPARGRAEGILLFTFIFAIITNCIAQEQKFVVIITSYNNAPWCVKNLETIFFQKNPERTDYYQNYRVIVIDDASDDGNAEYIQTYIYSSNQQHRCTIIKNKTRKRALANIYMALQLCEPDEIAINYDGDDWLAHDGVLALLSALYENPDIWITYGQFINWPTDQLGYCKPLPQEYVEKQLYRKKWWMPGQLRTFRVWLFNQIQLKDLLFEGPYFQGQFFPANSDLAIYYPMMEMAGYHYHFISEIIYIRNVETPINDFKANKDVQVLGSKLLRETKEIYPRLEAAQEHYFDQFKNRVADLIIFSENPDSAAALITSAQRLVLNLNKIYVLYQTESQQEQYQTLANALVTPVKSAPNFKDTLFSILLNAQDYIILAHDGMVFTHCTNCADDIFALEKAFAYGFYLSLGSQSATSLQTGMNQPMPALNYIAGDYYAWAFHYAATGDWRAYNTIAGALYRTQTVAQQTAGLDFGDYRELAKTWKSVPLNLENVGLCHEQPKVGYITWR